MQSYGWSINAPLPKLQEVPSTVASVSDYEPLARDRLTPQAWAYLSGGAADEITLHENCAAFRRLWLRSRVMQDLSGGDTRLELFGRTFEFPILLAPVAHQALFHPEGERATALAASAMSAGMVVSTQASLPIEDIARETTAPLWLQLYIQPDRDFTIDLVRRAEAAGYQALAVTVDAPVSGLRNREQRAGFALPPGVEAVNLRGMKQPEMYVGSPGEPVIFGGPLLAVAPTWNDLEWLVARTKLPVLVKGVMTAEDASRALKVGSAGVVVSNHGGRALDSQPATIDVLPEIVEAVDGRAPILIDGGIRRGGDVFKALALGAKATLIGRPYIHGLASAGAIGVSHVLHVLRAEFEVTMALTGCRSLADITAASIRR
ncbi:alpha-hydroxy acid oxidase [Methylocystis parvus]|uniref:alpha-hydroxy acid oxidase n=1 Tax=Methylocystis parvus TaxID=134 RepID=UPI0002E20C8D|nr:alpha-hydroxy acid oxidase [Methylocystis parvus]WBK01591.1 alpha-hydroxy-acid oxidizing protein [Methylocystis parvus OBBP]